MPTLPLVSITSLLAAASISLIEKPALLVPGTPAVIKKLSALALECERLTEGKPLPAVLTTNAPVIVPPALGSAALAVVLAAPAVVVVEVNIASLVAMSIPSTVPLTPILPVTSIPPSSITNLGPAPSTLNLNKPASAPP